MHGLLLEIMAVDKKQVGEFIVSEVMTKGRLQIKGFGSFYMKDQPSRKYRDPKTGELKETGDCRVLRFKASKTGA